MKYSFIKIILLFLILGKIIFAENPSNNFNSTDSIIDSLSNKLNLSKSDEEKINLLNQLAWHLATVDADKCISFADSAIKLSDNLNSSLKKAEALNNKGEAFRYKGQFEDALKYHKEALKIYKDENKLSKIAKTESNIGITYFNLSDFSKSFKHFDKALDIYIKEQDSDGILDVNSYLGIVFSNFGQHSKALRYFEKALEMARELKDKSKEGTMLNNLGLTYAELKNYQKAIEYYQKSINVFVSIKDEFNYAISLGNIGIPYVELGEYEKAIDYYNKSIKIAKKLGDNYGMAHQYGNLGELYFKLVKDSSKSIIKSKKNYFLENSIKYLNLSVKEFSSLSAIEDQKDYLEILSEVYEFAGRYKTSLQKYKEARALQDSIQSKENQKVIAGLEIKQELQNKEREITILNKDRAYQTSIRNILIIFGAFFVLTSFVILYMYRNKRRRNKKLEENIRIRKQAEADLRSKKLELEIYQQQLEKLVQERTIELETEINEHKKTEKDLLNAIEKAEAASKAKSVFLANMSHELRTPLTGILGYSDLLSSMIDDEEMKDMAAGINRTGQRLLNTVSLVLDLSRVESDRSEIIVKPIDVIEQIKEIYNNFTGAASVKNIQLKFDKHSDTFILNTDQVMLNVIVDNLVNNAIKFTVQGEVIIQTGIEVNNNNSYFSIKIKDTGIGIKEEEIPLVFEEFKQLSEGFTKDFQGSGLGLSITKKYVELLKGKIKVESTLGKGTTFTVLFPTKIKAVA